jgi:deoxyribodipyrimidine photolyase
MDDTIPDYERFERRQVAQDHDNRQVQTADVDESRARAIVQDLSAAGIVVAVPEDQCLVHRPSGERFDSDTALAHFHQGWEAATEYA